VGADLVQHTPTLERIRAAWAKRAKPMPPAVERQALVPVGAEVLENGEGSAPGLRMHIGRAECFFFAGVPVEFKHLVERHLLPCIAAASGRAVVTRTLRCVRAPESELDAALGDLVRGTGVRFGLRAVYPETWASFTAEAEDVAGARAVLDPIVSTAVSRIAPRCFSTEDESLAVVIARLLRKAGWTLAVGESCTGGMLGEEITSVPGSSSFFRGGVIAYANEEKVRGLGVSTELISHDGAVSEAVVRAMAEGAVQKSGATAGLSIVGIAGPDNGTTEKPVGSVWIALASPRGTLSEFHRFIRRDRESIRRGAVSAALDLLRRTLESAE